MFISAGRYRRGFDVGALTLFLGPPLGGLAFGIIADVNHIILAARGQGLPTTSRKGQRPAISSEP
jgi:hypothetical protein